MSTKIEVKDGELSGSWRIASGTYPEGATQSEVLTAVGCNYKQAMPKFRQFGNGTFTVTYCND